MNTKTVFSALMGLSLLVLIPVMAAEHQHGQTPAADSATEKKHCEAYQSEMDRGFAQLKTLKGEARVEQLSVMLEKMYGHQKMMHEHKHGQSH